MIFSLMATTLNPLMKEYSKALEQVLPEILQYDSYHDPKNQKNILEKIKKLTTTSSKISDAVSTEKNHKDPGFKIIAASIKSDSERALKAFNSGHKEYARSLLNSLSAACISCHTNQHRGPQFTFGTPNQLKGYDQAQFFFATRRYLEALKEYSHLIEDRIYPKRSPLYWERSIKKALIITIRVFKDPDQALQIIDLAIKNSSAPDFLKENFIFWKQDILDWKKEIKREVQTPQGLLLETKRLFTIGKSHQKYPLDRAGEIFFLRANGYAHEYLEKSDTSKEEAYLILGEIYQALNDTDYNLHERYFEFCIKEKPHTPTAETCYLRLEESIYAGYTGNSGLGLPETEHEYLKNLKASAFKNNLEKK